MASGELVIMVTTANLTADDVEQLPEDGRGEVIRGEMLEVCPTNWDHADIAGNVVTSLKIWIRPRRLGFAGVEAGFVIATEPLTVLAPDVAFVRAERLPSPDWREKFLPIAPDLAVEIVSPSESSRETHDKILLYLEAGTPIVWVIYPRRRTVTVHTQDRMARILSEGEMLDGGDVLPGFTLPVAEVFA